LLLLGLVSSLSAQPSDFISYQDENTLILPAEVQKRLEAIKAHPAADSVRLVQFHNLSSLLSVRELRFSLPGIDSVVANVVAVGQPDGSNVAWSGTLKESQSPIFFVVVEGAVSGMIHTREYVFRIKPLGDGYHALYRVSTNRNSALTTPTA